EGDGAPVRTHAFLWLRERLLRPMWSPTRPRGHRDVRARSGPGAGRWQVFGLAGSSSVPEDAYWPSLPGSGTSDPVRVTAVVPAHRCGAVPDSHRVPSCDAPAVGVPHAFRGYGGGRGEPAALASLRG